MRRKAAVLACLLILFVAVYLVPVHAAPAVDGFVGVPWGVTAAQLDTAMKDQQAIANDLSNQDWKSYYGLFAGERRLLVCKFKYNSFYRGHAYVFDQSLNPWSANDIERSAAIWRDKLSGKYGPPTARADITPETNRQYLDYSIFVPGYRVYWQGLQAANGDEIEIVMEVRLPGKYDGNNVTGAVAIVYIDVSLKKRLDDRGKDNF